MFDSPMFDPPERLRNRPLTKHSAAQRSARLASTIAAIPEHQRTPLQARLLAQHEQSECIGCTRQGIPTDEYGNDVQIRYEHNGFAYPPEYCDCPRGQRYQQEMEQRRNCYDLEWVQAHLRYLRYLFGPACILPPVRDSWTFENWPLELPCSEEWTEEERACVRSMRQSVLEAVQIYAVHQVIEDEPRLKRGLALFGPPGVGKTGLLRCLERQLLAQGHSMVSLYVPDLVVALESEQVEQMIAAIRATDIVLFDNLGYAVPLGYKETQGRSALIRLINARCERQQRTLFTTNLVEEQLIEQLGEDSVSRLYALCRFFEVPGVDLRK